ncbi:MAG: LysR family transcriptional regulator [Mobilitalea sp.]
MEINHLKAFVETARQEHMTKAAEILQISQPALSKTIHLMEQELGVTLFDRAGKRILLNENGRILLSHANSILMELEEIPVEIQEYNSTLQNEVILSLQAGSKLLPLILLGFRSHHPEIKISVTLEEEADITVFATRLPANEENSIILLKEKILLAVPSNHPLALCSSINLIDVKDEPFLSLSSRKSLGRITCEYCQMAGFTPQIILESDSPSTIRDVLPLGVGLSFIPELSWQGMNCENISLIPITDPDCYRYLNLSWKSTHYLPRATALLKDYLISFFHDLS